MLQEIITYLIVVLAATLAILKISMKLMPRKKVSKSDLKIDSAKLQTHNCAECSAECQLRDLPKIIIEKNIDECVQVVKRSKALQS